MIERTSSSDWVRGVVDMFRAEGLDVQRLFREAQLDPRLLDDPNGRFSIDDVSVLWELAVQRSGKATLGLSRELAITYANFGIVRYAMMSCPTLLMALRRLVRYMDLVSNAATFSITEEVPGHWIALGHLGGERPVPRQRAEFGMLAMVVSCGWFIGRGLDALAVDFVYPEPADATPLHQAFRCPVRFGQAQNRALISHADLAVPLSARDAAMASLHERIVDAELERLDGARITSARVQQLIAARLVQGAQADPGEPRREQIAAALHLSDRTLQRRLHAEGSSFQRLLDDTRRELAQQHLRTPGHSLKRVADLLGFEDDSNFFRACKRWFGQSPAQYRQRFGVEGVPIAPSTRPHG